jgi:hypothetical protein
MFINTLSTHGPQLTIIMLKKEVSLNFFKVRGLKGIDRFGKMRLTSRGGVQYLRDYLISLSLACHN